MKKSISIILVLGLIGLSGFKNEPMIHEQIAFDYFVSDVLGADFKDVTSFEFKGKTEKSFSTLGEYKFCLKPEEKLGAIIEETTKGKRKDVQEIKFRNSTDLKITDFHNNTSGYRLFVYPSVHVADNYYVFLSFQNQKEQPAKYVFELTPEGKILRSCKTN